MPIAFSPIGERLVETRSACCMVCFGEFESLTELIDKVARAEVTPPAASTTPASQKPTSENWKKRSYRPSISEQSPASSSGSGNGNGNGNGNGSGSGALLPPAPWTSPEEQQTRQESGLCYRCGVSGHKASGCPTYSRTRPRYLDESVRMDGPLARRQVKRQKSFEAGAGVKREG